MIFALSPLLGALVAVLGAAQVVVLLSARRRNQHLMGEALATEAKSQSYAYEMFSAVETLKAAGAERRAVTHWTNLFIAEMNVSLRRGRLSAVVETAIHGLALLSPIALLLVGAHLVGSGQLSLGTMLALAALGGAFLEPLAILVGTALQVQLLGSYLARIEDVINTPTETDGRDLQHAPRLTGAVRAEGLTFRYHARTVPPAVDSADLEVQPGQVLAIVGRSGSGKSTMGRLLLGLYPPSEGRVLLDGIDLATLYPRSVRSQIGVVTQDPYIFGLSIRDNLVLGHPESAAGAARDRRRTGRRRRRHPRDADGVGHPARRRGRLTVGWSTPAAGPGPRARHRRRGSCCSTRPPAASTPSPRPQVHANIARLGCTVIVIAHRLATVIDADRIVVMDAGRVVEVGRHRDLAGRAADTTHNWLPGNSSARPRIREGIEVRR